MEDTDRPGRLETGVAQMPNDWPGIFIRGDTAIMGYAPALRRMLQMAPAPSSLDREMLSDLLALLQSCHAKAIEDNNTRVQKIAWDYDEAPTDPAHGGKIWGGPK